MREAVGGVRRNRDPVRPAVVEPDGSHLADQVPVAHRSPAALELRTLHLAQTQRWLGVIWPINFRTGLLLRRQRSRAENRAWSSSAHRVWPKAVYGGRTRRYCTTVSSSPASRITAGTRRPAFFGVPRPRHSFSATALSDLVIALRTRALVGPESDRRNAATDSGTLDVDQATPVRQLPTVNEVRDRTATTETPAGPLS